jgi:hypothetical protein
MAYAAQCHQMADRAQDERVRAAWLKLASCWLDIATKNVAPAENGSVGDQTFRAMVDTRASGQKDSTSSH